ncbi:hypothetical protein G0Q06_13515 [Puniceicoccales bacterium CK1056]|uniref:Uncharacterized protein n=1 Tax=Oceanipulchritudo coccoides TaxID=2706888 RepID=A0A6B2M3E2_9BACT|nr:hypothetical protein [Oceanipulchritudo coccoides]NDV63478.1 hypothetical protein [Oceanipulchritudo coccoides]
MKKSTKVVLFSLLVFPGTGHFLLRLWSWGILFMVGTLIPVIFVVKYAYNRANSIMDRIISGEVPLDPAAIQVLIYEKPTGDDALLLGIAHVVLLVCWIGSVAHSYVKAEAGGTQNAPPLLDEKVTGN